MSEGRQGIEWPGGVRVTVVDQKNPEASFTIFDGVRSALPFRAGLEPTYGMFGALEATGRFARAGTASYAGQTCTAWRCEDGRSTRGVCVTDDGAMLRGVTTSQHEGQAQTGGLEAMRVDYGPQDPARFRHPEGYRVVTRAVRTPATPGDDHGPTAR